MNIKVYDPKGKELDAWKLDAKLFGEARVALLSQAVRIYSSNSHQKTHKVKTRGEVVGSTKKIYRQKGTGNARHGAKYAPIFVGGGVAHGPSGVRPDNMVLPKTMRRRALASAMQLKLSASAIAGISGVKTFPSKTSAVVKLLAMIAKHPKNKVLIITCAAVTPLYNSVSNLQNVTMKRAALVNAFDLISADFVVLTKKALTVISERAL